MQIQKREMISWIWMALATVAVFVLLSARRCETDLSVQQYSVSSGKITEPVRIVQLSDLHSHVFGEDNDILVELVAEQKPDLIAMTGDMLDKQDENADVVCRLIRDLQDVAPIYYCHGNHEMDWIPRHGNDLNSRLEEAGAVVLDTDFADIAVNGQQIRIGGFHGYYRYWGMLPRNGGEEEFAEDFENTENFKLLLNHIPTGWIDWHRMHDFPVDLVLTGHYHGGQIRIPLIGGIYAPYVGLFPQYTEGIYYGEQATCILSTGLGSSPGIPRIHNLPQVVVVELMPE